MLVYICNNWNNNEKYPVDSDKADIGLRGVATVKRVACYIFLLEVRYITNNKLPTATRMKGNKTHCRKYDNLRNNGC